MDFQHPKAAIRLHHIIRHLKREATLKLAMYEHDRQMRLLQILAALPTGHSHMSELVHLEERQNDYIRELHLGKQEVDRSPAKLAKQWTDAWNKAFGDQSDPAVQAKIEAAAAALLRR